MATQNDADQRLASGLGWFSIGLGLAEFLAPQKMARLIGLSEENGNTTLLRIYGVREMAAGVGILMQPRQPGWMWARVAGDALDLASLGSALTDEDADRSKVAAATAAVLGVTALDVLCAQKLSSASGEQIAPGSGAVHVTKTTIVGRPAEEVYGFWRDFRNFPNFMKHLESVELTGENRSHWKAEGSGGRTMEWDAETVEDQPNSRISWRSLEGSDVDHSGSVSFERAPGGRGTLVRVKLDYSVAGGALSATLAKLFGKEPGQEIEDDLRAFKQVMETGEVVRSDASIHRGMHAAQPSVQSATA